MGRGGEGWGGVGMGVCDPTTRQASKFRFLNVFLYIFSGFAIDRSKKYIKVINNYIKIDAVDPQAAADNHPHPSVTMVRCQHTHNPQNPVK